MIEAGVAVIAICLPSLSPLLGHRSVQSLVGSVRSAISLHSLASRHAGGSGGSNGPKDSRHGNQNSPEFNRDTINDTQAKIYEPSIDKVKIQMKPESRTESVPSLPRLHPAHV